MWIVSTVVGVLLAMMAYTGAYLVTPHHGRGVPVRVALPEPRTPDRVAATLYNAGVLDRPWLFAWLITLTGTSGEPATGDLVLRDDLTPRSILRALASGRSVIRVTIPEGLNRFEIARRLADAGIVPDVQAFVRATEDPAVLAQYGIRGPSLEGYLFPDSYDLAPDSTPAEVIERMVQTFRRRFAAVRSRDPNGAARAARAGLDDGALVTLASMVEKETGAPEDRARIAAVFWNRLTFPEFQPRLLQSDPTIVYGCTVAHPPSCPTAPTGRTGITRAMLDDAQNPYNTYQHEGLPPGPIANPGLRALEAVLSPATTRDLYFVAMGNGRSAFATTRAEHEANVQRYVRRRDPMP